MRRAVFSRQSRSSRVTRQIAIGADCPEVIVDMGHRSLRIDLPGQAIRVLMPSQSARIPQRPVTHARHDRTLADRRHANKPLAAAIARRMSMHRGMNVGLCDARVERFNDQEIFRRGVRECARRGYVYHPADLEPGQ